MPGQDRTGPRGQGPRTGRQMGDCEGARPVRGFGIGFGFRGVGQNVELTSEQEKKVLEAELAEVEAEKKELEDALKKIK